LTALDAKTGKILWRAYTLPAAGEPGGDTWPAGTDHYSRGGASIWNTPALDPELGLVYFAVGNCGPDYDGAMREGDNLFCASVLAVNAKTGAYAWHFQEVHHDIWDYDAASPVVLFDTAINGQPRKGIAQAGGQLLEVATGTKVRRLPAGGGSHERTRLCLEIPC
jgi:alcohol dehydrogenase (cytochrome c)